MCTRLSIKQLCLVLVQPAHPTVLLKGLAPTAPFRLRASRAAALATGRDGLGFRVVGTLGTLE